MRSFIFTLLTALILHLPALAKEPILTATGTVAKVSDGDTVHVVTSGAKLRVRLYGIDAPETAKRGKPGQPYGEEAARALRAKVAGRQVRVDVMDTDRYRRSVAILWLDGWDVNREMVAEGYAWAYRQYLDRPHASEYLSAEESARRARLGLWQQNNPQPPWEFRRAQRTRGK